MYTYVYPFIGCLHLTTNCGHVLQNIKSAIDYQEFRHQRRRSFLKYGRSNLWVHLFFLIPPMWQGIKEPKSRLKKCH